MYTKVLFIGALSLTSFVANSKASLAFDKINDYLEKNCQDNDADVNIMKAKELLEYETSKDHGFFHLNIEETLRNFIKLSELTTSDSCNRASYLILQANNEATGDRARLGWDLKRRGDMLVRLFSAEHAMVCRYFYYKRLNEIVNNLDPVLYNYVRSFTDPNIEILVDQHGVDLSTHTPNPHTLDDDMDSHELFDIIQATSYIDVRGMARNAYAENAYKAILSQAVSEGDPDIKYLRPVAEEARLPKVNKEKLFGLYKKYILYPCAYFIQAVGPDVLEPAIYDFDFDQNFDEKKDRSFYLNWFRYNLCQNLQKYDSEYLFKKISRVAKSLF